MSDAFEIVGMNFSGIDTPVSPMPTEPGQPAWDIARLFPAQGAWTEEQYLQTAERSSCLLEFDNGNIEVLPMPTIEHQLIAVHLLVLLREFVMKNRLGMVLSAPHPTWLTENEYREPDVIFKKRENLPGKDEKYFRGADLAVEVVSPDDRSHQRDYVDKRELYAAAGVAEYWIVDPQQQRVLVLALNGDKYTEHADLTGSGTAPSRLLDGFKVDVAAVFAAGKQR